MATESERVVVAFQTGEISPVYGARSDIEKLGSGARTCQNMVLGVFGYAERRSGTQYVAHTKASEPVVSST